MKLPKLFYIFGLNATTGTLNYSCQNNNSSSTSTSNNNITFDPSGNIIIYNPYYNPMTNPVYYQSPNIIVPNPTANDPTVKTTPITQKTYNPVPRGSSSPAYQS